MGKSAPHALFVYGTLVEPAIREQLLGRRIMASEARLPGFERRSGRYYYVVRKDGAETAGMILRGLSEDDLRVLDEYEEVPHLYTRERAVAVTAEGRVRCWVYAGVSKPKP